MVEEPDEEAPPEQPADEDDQEDDSCLMQNGVQMGDVAPSVVEALEGDLRTKLDRVMGHSAAKSKNLMFVVGAMVARNMKSKLPSMRQVCQALQTVLNEHAGKVGEAKREMAQSHQEWSRRYWKRVRSKCRQAIAKHRRKQNRERLAKEKRQKQECATDEPQQQTEMEEGEAMNLMQMGMWLEALQEDLDFHKAMGEKVGAHANQLMVYLLSLQPGANAESWEATQALLATYVNEAADESRGDKADEFAAKWQRRLAVLLFIRDAGMVEDTPEEAADKDLEDLRMALEGDKLERC